MIHQISYFFETMLKKLFKVAHILRKKNKCTVRESESSVSVQDLFHKLPLDMLTAVMMNLSYKEVALLREISTFFKSAAENFLSR